MQTASSIIIAPATPPGEAALAVIRLSGQGCIALFDAYFPGHQLTNATPRRALFGILQDETGQTIDEVVLTVYRAPASYTGEDSVEISCHGSPYVVQRILELGGAAGAKLAQPGEFTQRAFLNGKLDLSQAEAVADLIASQSAAAHRLALGQLRGGVSNEISELRGKLVDFASLIELELDFGEEDVEFADRSQLSALVRTIRGRIAGLTASFRLGNAIKRGVSTVIAGRPNAGKSTLLNALLNEDRAIVSPIAGTTRDTIEEVVNIEGVTFRLIDTAGIREAGDTIEAMGVERTLKQVATSQLLIYVFDIIETDPDALALDLNRLYREELELVVVANKMDLNPYTKYSHYFGHGQKIEWTLPQERWIPMIASEGSNLQYLKDTLLDVITKGRGGIGAEDVILSNARHYDALRRADEALQRVADGLTSGLSQDFVAMDIRQSLRDLGEITGEITTDDLLGNIFSNFCIGK